MDNQHLNTVITVEPTTDEAYIKSVFLNPLIYESMKDDSSPKEPNELSGVNILSLPGVFFRVMVDGVAAGVFLALKKGDTFEAHTALLPNCRGRDAIRAAKAAQDWVWRNTDAREITSYAWSDSPAVAWFCRAAGMTKTETKPWQSTRNGKPVDISYYAIGRAL